MRFGISRILTGQTPLIELSHEQFRAAVEARARIGSVLEVEEKFNLLLENYEEYERELITLALRDSVFDRDAWATLTADMYAVNRRLINLLASGRLYLDHLRHDISTMWGRESEVFTGLGSCISEQYDQVFAYRLMEAIRNHSQHRELPIHTMSYETRRVDVRDAVWARHTVRPGLAVDVLEADTTMKRAVVEELQRLGGDDADISLFVRQYIDALRRIHVFVRARVFEGASDWDQALKALLAMGRQQFVEENARVWLVALHDDDTIAQAVVVFPEVLERRRFLERRNRNLGDRATHYVSNRP